MKEPWRDMHFFAIILSYSEKKMYFDSAQGRMTVILYAVVEEMVGHRAPSISTQGKDSGSHCLL